MIHSYARIYNYRSAPFASASHFEGVMLVLARSGPISTYEACPGPCGPRLPPGSLIVIAFFNLRHEAAHMTSRPTSRNAPSLYLFVQLPQALYTMPVNSGMERSCGPSLIPRLSSLSNPNVGLEMQTRVLRSASYGLIRRIRKRSCSVSEWSPRGHPEATQDKSNTMNFARRKL
jgi:hypothetical protein